MQTGLALHSHWLVSRASAWASASGVGKDAGAASVSSATGAMNRYPRFVTVSMKTGLSGLSPSILRISRMYFLRISGLTYVSDHRAYQKLVLSNQASWVFNKIA